jgi:ribosome maturation factor RimP
VLKQYEKNLGNEVEVLTKDGKKLTGILMLCDDAKIILQQEKLVKPEGAKRKTTIVEETEIPYTNIKTTKYIIRFK